MKLRISPGRAARRQTRKEATVMSTMVEFVTVGGMLAVTPGPNMVCVMSRSVSQGRRAVLMSLAGVIGDDAGVREIVGRIDDVGDVRRVEVRRRRPEKSSSRPVLVVGGERQVVTTWELIEGEPQAV